MFLDFGEQVIPTSNNSAFVLIVDQFQFKSVPYISNLQENDNTI